MMTKILLLRTIYLFAALLFFGSVATLPLFHFNIKKFLHSSLYIKILLWIPIFLVFVFSLYVHNHGRLIIAIILLVIALKELAAVLKDHEAEGREIVAYFLLFSFALLHFYLLGVIFPASIIGLLIILCFGSVLSDVGAFFFGTYTGRHKLPKGLNDHKSWEGVLGQIIGALFGVVLVRQFVIRSNSVWIFVPIGLGSACGDLVNSFITRRVGIKDWGTSIPGHGGYIDRLSSLAFAMMFTYYFLRVF
jgi:CDP-diglyceride synthetase